MTRDDIIKLAQRKGRAVKPCDDPGYVLVDCGPAPYRNERFRITANGTFLTVGEGRYWQIVPTEFAAALLEAVGDKP